MPKHKNKSLKAKTGVALRSIDPLTAMQKQVFDSGNHMVLKGVAGTGKTFISLYLSFLDIETSLYDRVIVLRSAVPTRDVGYLPGNLLEKISVYEDPYRAIVTDLFGRGDAYSVLKQHDIFRFSTTSYIRGTTIEDSVVIVDECQNMSFHELDSIITRVGENCRIIFCGDFEQTDFSTESKTGLKQFLDILDRTDLFDFFTFGLEDIVRSGLVKEYLMAKHGWV